MARFTRLAPLGLALPLAACLSFGEEPPATLMTLTPASVMAPGAQQAATDGQAISISIPSVVPTVASLRVPVQQSATGVAYLKDAQWSAAPSLLFRNLLAETVAARTGLLVLDPRRPVVASGIRLSGRLTMFGVDEPKREAVVSYDAALVRDGAGRAQTKRFEARVPLAAIDAVNVAPALDQAANQVATQVADWIGR